MKLFKALGLVALLGFAIVGVVSIAERNAPSSNTEVASPSTTSTNTPPESEQEAASSVANIKAVTDYNEVKDETHVGLPPIYLDKEFAVQAAYFVSGATIKRPDEVYLHFAHLSDTRHWSEVNVVYFAQGNTRVHYDASTPKSGQRKSGGWESIDVWMPVDKFQQLVDGDRLLIQIGNDNLTVSGEHIKPFKEFSSEIPSS